MKATRLPYPPKKNKARTYAGVVRRFKLIDRLWSDKDYTFMDYWGEQPYWFAESLPRIVELLNYHYDELDLKVIGPFGLDCECWLVQKDKTASSPFRLCLVAHNLFDPGYDMLADKDFSAPKVLPVFRPGTIGALNGLDAVRHPLGRDTTIEDLYGLGTRDLSG